MRTEHAGGSGAPGARRPAWKVVSLVAAEPLEYASKLVDFTADTATTTTTLKDGTVTTVTEKYKVVGDALPVPREKGVINAQLALDGGR